MNEFTVHLLSFDSVNILPENTLTNLRNYFSEETSLEGDWRVALSGIIFPSKTNEVKSDHIIKFIEQGYKWHQKSIPAGAVSKPYEGQRFPIKLEVLKTLHI